MVFELSEDPFDMAPEMNKQFSRMPVVKSKKNEFDIMDDLVNECNDLNQYMERIDALIENKYVINQ